MTRRIAGRILSFYPRSTTLVVYGSKLGDDEIPEPAPESLIFRELHEGDFERDDMFAEKGRRERFKLRLRDGHRSYGFVEPSSGIASYIWLCLPASGTPETFTWALGSRMRVSRESGYIYDCRTRADWRGRALYPAGLVEAKRLCRDADADRVFIDCVPDNIPSLRGIAKAGFTPCCRIGVLRAGPFYMSRCGRAVQYATRGFNLPLTCYDRL